MEKEQTPRRRRSKSRRKPSSASETSPAAYPTLAPIDILQARELAHLVEEVETTGKRRRFTRGNRDVAVLSPAGDADPAVAADANAILAELARRRRHGLNIVAATAGIVRYDGPVLTREQEKVALAQGVADAVTERLGD